MGWSCSDHRQHHLHLATLVTRPDSVWFLFYLIQVQLDVHYILYFLDNSPTCFGCYLHPWPIIRSTTVAYSHRFCVVLCVIPLEQVLVWDTFTLEHGQLQTVISSCGFLSRIVFTSHHFPRHYQNCENASTLQSGTSRKTRLRGFGGNGRIAWTPAMSHVGRTSNAFKVTMKLQTLLFQMLVTSCISVQYLWK
jgi:hypothetical protein